MLKLKNFKAVGKEPDYRDKKGLALRAQKVRRTVSLKNSKVTFLFFDFINHYSKIKSC